MAKAAKPHLGSRGDALVPALLATLRAGALDEDVAEQLRTGTLSTEHEQAGFGFGLETGDGAVAPRRATKTPAKKAAARPKLQAVPDLPEPDPEEIAQEKAERGRGPRRRAPAQEGPRRRREERRPPRARGRAPGQGGRRGRGRRPRRPRGRRRHGRAADARRRRGDARVAGLGGRGRPAGSLDPSQPNERAPARSQT